MIDTKFRVWSNSEQKYLDELEYYIDFDGAVHEKLYYSTPEEEDVTLELSTGYVDQNGIKVFENDIVQMEYTTGHHESWDMNTFAKTEDYNEVETYVRGVVRIWKSKGVVLVNLIPDDLEQFNDEHKIPDFINVTRYCNVIGNIHENQELLGK